MTSNYNNKDNNQSSDSAHAPYNFVALPDKVKIAPQKPPTFDVYHSDKLSGYFECTLKTKTPLYIRNTLTEEMYLEREEGQTLDDEAEANFFQPGGKVRLPGSSLRGMIRTLVEIMSNAQFLNYSDAQLFYRAVGGRTAQTIVQKYRNRLTHTGQNAAQGGYMVKENGIYYIYPAEALGGYTFYQIFTDRANAVVRSEYTKRIRGKEHPEWGRKEIWFKLPPTSRGTKPLIQEIKGKNEPKPGDGWYAGWAIISGAIPGKKRSWIIPARPNNSQQTPIEVPIEDIQAYRDGGGITPEIKDKDFSILPEADEEWPCFFIEWIDLKGQRRVSFGHTGYFRLPYENQPSNLLKTQLPGLPETELDLAQAIFGTAAGHKAGKAGRVYFEDAFPEGEANLETTEPVSPKILSGPKATTFQHYLDQSEAENYSSSVERMRNLSFWDSPGAQIRGYKLYWHQNNPNWQETDQDRINSATTQYTKIKPLAAGNTFKFRVRFDNLSEIELGALAAALQLPKGCAHKLGMGKPLGLGSVEVDAKLVIIDRFSRYSSLFDKLNQNGEANWQTGIGNQVKDIVFYQNKFANWLDKGKTLTDLWNEPNARWQDLKALLSFENGLLAIQTSYMKIEDENGVNEYKERPILPRAFRIWQAAQSNPEVAVEAVEGDASAPPSEEQLQQLFSQFGRISQSKKKK